MHCPLGSHYEGARVEAPVPKRGEQWTRPALRRNTAPDFARLGAGNVEGTPVMLGEKVFDDISARVAAAMAASPVRDVEKNVRALLRGALGRLDLVSREEFDIQVALLARTREKLEALEERVASLEADAKTAAK